MTTALIPLPRPPPLPGGAIPARRNDLVTGTAL